jgi:hypothetical protein
MLKTDIHQICDSITNTDSCLYSYRTLLIEIYHYQLSHKKTPIHIFVSFFATCHDGLWYYNTLDRLGYLSDGKVAWPPLRHMPITVTKDSMFEFITMRNDIIIPVTSVFMDQQKLKECFDLYSVFM